MDTYPRYTIVDAEGVRLAYRVSFAAGRAITEALAHERHPFGLTEYERGPRFRIRMATWPTRTPVILVDAERRAFRGQYRTIENACRAMDNIVRRELGMPERLAITTAEIRERMKPTIRHYMGNDLLDACGTAPSGPLVSTPIAADVTCPACRKMIGFAS